MVDAHTEAGFAAGRPFSYDGIYDFSLHGNLTGRWVGGREDPLDFLFLVPTGGPDNLMAHFSQYSDVLLMRRVTEMGSIMLKNRLTPPPDEAYSLHRKLSGAFLACIKLRARVPCRQLFYAMYDRVKAGKKVVD